MFSFDSLTCVTLGHVLSYFSLHIVPPEHFFKIHIHLRTSWMYRVWCLVCFLKNYFFDFRNIWYTDSALKPSRILLPEFEHGLSSFINSTNLFDDVCILVLSSYNLPSQVYIHLRYRPYMFGSCRWFLL